MKNTILVCASMAFFALVSCTENKEEEAKEEPTTIVVEKETTTPQPKEEDGTSLKIDENGVEFSKKEGNTEVDVDLKK